PPRRTLAPRAARGGRAIAPHAAFRANRPPHRGSARAAHWQPRSPRPRRSLPTPRARAPRVSDSPTAATATAIVVPSAPTSTATATEVPRATATRAALL